MANRKSRLVPLLWLGVGIAGGWWIAQYGLPQLQTRLNAGRPGPGADIRRVDFQNFSFPAACAEEAGLSGNIPVQDGEYVRNDESGRFYFGIEAVSYGDLTGDGQAEAMVAASCNSGGTGQFSEGMLFTMHGDTPVLIGRVQGGDRAFGGLAGLSIEAGRVIVEKYATDEDGPACCPRYIDVQRLRWDGKQLVPVGAATRRAVSTD